MTPTRQTGRVAYHRAQLVELNTDKVEFCPSYFSFLNYARELRNPSSVPCAPSTHEELLTFGQLMMTTQSYLPMVRVQNSIQLAVEPVTPRITFKNSRQSSLLQLQSDLLLHTIKIASCALVSCR